ncbi:THO complex subunit 5 [Pelomyxa schiedti]|nr:THO complex subunit 5 [Pelomyxa schiedti]
MQLGAGASVLGRIYDLLSGRRSPPKDGNDDSNNNNSKEQCRNMGGDRPMSRHAEVLFVALKRAHREAILGVEKTRLSVQNSRERLEVLDRRLHALSYTHAHLQSQISGCRMAGFLASSISKLAPDSVFFKSSLALQLPSPLNVQPPSPTTSPTDVHLYTKARLTFELEYRKKLLEQLEERRARKKALTEMLAVNKRFLISIPELIGKLKQDAQQGSQSFSVTVLPTAHVNSCFLLPPALYTLYTNIWSYVTAKDSDLTVRIIERKPETTCVSPYTVALEITSEIKVTISFDLVDCQSVPVCSCVCKSCCQSGGKKISVTLVFPSANTSSQFSFGTTFLLSNIFTGDPGLSTGSGNSQLFMWAQWLSGLHSSPFECRDSMVEETLKRLKWRLKALSSLSTQLSLLLKGTILQIPNFPKTGTVLSSFTEILETQPPAVAPSQPSTAVPPPRSPSPNPSVDLTTSEALVEDGELTCGAPPPPPPPPPKPVTRSTTPPPSSSHTVIPQLSSLQRVRSFRAVLTCSNRQMECVIEITPQYPVISPQWSIKLGSITGNASATGLQSPPRPPLSPAHKLTQITSPLSSPLLFDNALKAIEVSINSFGKDVSNWYCTKANLLLTHQLRSLQVLLDSYVESNKATRCGRDRHLIIDNTTFQRRRTSNHHDSDYEGDGAGARRDGVARGVGRRPRALARAQAPPWAPPPPEDQARGDAVRGGRGAVPAEGRGAQGTRGPSQQVARGPARGGGGGEHLVRGLAHRMEEDGERERGGDGNRGRSGRGRRSKPENDDGDGQDEEEEEGEQGVHRLVGGGWPGLTWESNREQNIGVGGVEERGGRTGANYWGEQELAENVRACGILRGVCERGWMEVAKWLIQRFGIKDPWEFVQPLGSALAGGHLELAQWMVDTFDLVPRFNRYSSVDFHSKACKSGNLDVVKWCFETFPHVDIYSTVTGCIGGKRSSSVEICNYVSKHIEFPDDLDPLEEGSIRRLDVLKWVMSELPAVDESVSMEVVEDFSRKSEGIEFIKFFVESNLITVTPALFLTACKNFKDSTQLKWLSTRLSLSQEDIDNSFVTALGHSNTLIASWLEDSHHILERYKGVTAAGQLLVRVCKGIPFFRGGVAGLEWLLRRLDFTGTLQHQTGFVVDGVRELLINPKSTRAASLLLEKFPMISEQDKSELLTQALRESIQRDSLQQVQTIASMVENNIHGLTKESVSKCLLCPVGFHSSKAVKWLITHFQLQREHITADNNKILFKLISWGQECCAEWLINRFTITLEEVLRLSWGPSSFLLVDLATWQMIVEVLPGITADNIKEKFLKLVCHSPVITQFTLRHFPDVTIQDITDRHNSAVYSYCGGGGGGGGQQAVVTGLYFPVCSVGTGKGTLRRRASYGDSFSSFGHHDANFPEGWKESTGIKTTPANGIEHSRPIKRRRSISPAVHEMALTTDDIFNLLRDIKDPDCIENSLESSHIICRDLIKVDSRTGIIQVGILPTCQTTNVALVGLCIRTRLDQDLILPLTHKVDLIVFPPPSLNKNAENNNTNSSNNPPDKQQVLSCTSYGTTTATSSSTCQAQQVTTPTPNSHNHHHDDLWPQYKKHCQHPLTKQLNDKERVAAAMEQQPLLVAVLSLL